MPTCDRFENGERQSGYSCVCFATYSQFTDSVLLHIRAALRRRGITVPRNSLTRCTARHLRFRRLVQFILAGPVSNNALKNCAARLCRTCADSPICVAVRYLTLRTGFERHGRKNPLPFSFSERSHIGNLRQIRKQGKGRSSKRKENRRCPFLFALRRGYGAVPAAGAATLPPSADGESPPLRFSEKLPARQGRTRLRQFVCPAQPVQKRSRPDRANPPAAVRVPRSAGAAKGAARQGRTRLRQFACPAQPMQKRSRPSGANPPEAVRVP